MTKQKSTKRALLCSVLSLLMCVAMLIGSTFAWFTDSVTSGNNVITAGNLDLAVEYTLDGKNWADLDGATALFQKGLWEPGHTEVVALRIKNNGSLALKYAANMNIVSEVVGKNKTGDDIVLSDILTVSTLVQQTGPIGDIAVDLAFSGENKVAYETTTSFKDGNVIRADKELLPGDAQYAIIKVDMPETVGNEANHNGIDIPEINFGINVLATQYTKEDDSFGNQYDKDAVYGTYIELNAGEDLLAAMASAEKDMPLTIKLNGNVEWPTEGHHGENDITPASSIVIDGNGNTITATGSGVTPLGDQTAPMTLKNVTIVDHSVSYNEGAWEFTYLEMGGTKLTCENVTFADEIQLGTEATFTNCSFESNEESVYAVWVEDGSASFTKCTFTGYRGLKMHEDYGSEINSVVVKNCTFSNISKKPGIAIGTLNADTTVSITNSKFINCQPGDQNLHIYETDTDVSAFKFTNKNNTVLNNISNIVEIATKADLFAFAKKVNGGDSMSKNLVVLTADIDLENQLWTPVGQTGATEFKGIFDGQGYTIKNLNVDSSAQTGAHYSSGLFGWIESHGQDITIKNVNVDGATVIGHHNVAVIAGYMEGGSVIDNCNVKNATLKNTHANDDACGDKTGVIAGYVAGAVTIKNCAVSASTVQGSRDAGQLIGASYAVPVNCTATDVSVSASGDCTGANVLNDLVGRKLGTAWN